MAESFINGLAGVRATKTATPRIIFKQGDWYSDLALGKIINGSLSRDPLNTGALDVLRAGLLMGKLASGKYAPSVMGTLTVASLASATSLTVSAATATELNRRVGSSSTLKLTGPPTVAGTVATETVTYSAVNTSTGVITCSAVTAAFILGSFVQPTDGSETAKTLIPDTAGIKVTDSDSTTNIDVQFPDFPLAGVLISTQIINWPSDTSLRSQVRSWLDGVNGGGKYVFDDSF